MHSLRELMKRKAYRTFFLSFVMVFLLPVLVLLLVLGRMTNTVRQEAEMSNRLVLEQFIGGVDGQLYTVMRLADSILLDDKAVFFAEKRDPMRYLNNITTFQMLKNLTQEVGIMPTVYTDIQMSYLYMPRSGMVISNTISGAQDFYSRKLAQSIPGGMDAWLDVLLARPNGFFRDEAVQYLRTLRRGDEALATVIIVVDDRPFDNYRAVFDTQSRVEAAVFSGEGEPLFYTSEQPPELTEAMRAQAQGEISLHDGDAHEAQRVHWKRSAQTGCLFMTLVPESVYSRPMHTLRVSMLLGVCALLGVGLWLSLLLARRQYRPILALRNFIDRGARQQDDTYRDDFDYLSEMMRAMDAQSKSTQLQMRDTQARMEQFALERVLKGMFGSVSDIQEDLLALNITLDGEAFLVIGMRIDGIEEGRQELNLQDRQLMRFVVSNVFDELLDAYGAVSTVSDGTVWVICPVPPDAPWQEDIEAQLRRGRQLLRERFNFSLTIAASDRVFGVDGIHRGYRAALALLRASEHKGDEFMLGYRAREATEGGMEPLSMHALAQRLGQIIAQGDEAGAQHLLATLHEQLAQLEPYMAHLHWNALLQGVLPTLYMPAAQEDVARRVRAFVEGSPLQDDYAEMQSLCAWLCALPRARAETGRGVDIGQRVRRYIEENYADTGLSIAQVAEHLNLTSSYASTLYKKQTGESMLDTINQVRLAHAKECLMDPEMTIEEISAEAGYYSTSTFLRAFRKYEGVTPGQWRQMNSVPGA